MKRNKFDIGLKYQSVPKFKGELKLREGTFVFKRCQKWHTITYKIPMLCFEMRKNEVPFVSKLHNFEIGLKMKKDIGNMTY